MPEKFHDNLLTESAEKELANQLKDLSKKIGPLSKSRDYTAILQQLSALKDPVDAFFDHVMVMTDDIKIRQNRLALLNQLRNLFLDVADISQLQSAGS